MTLSKKGSAKRRAGAPPPAVAVAVSASTTATPRKLLRERFDHMRAIVRWYRYLSRPAWAAWTVCWNHAPHDGRSFYMAASTVAREASGCDRAEAVRGLGKLRALGLIELVKKGNSFTKEASTYQIPRVLPHPPD